jgi:hypothetical protein
MSGSMTVAGGGRATGTRSPDRRPIHAGVWPLVITTVSLSAIGVLGVDWAICFANDFRGFRQPIGDFAAFYAVGEMLNQNPPQNIYDFQAHTAAMRRVSANFPDRPTLPYTHAPFEALMLRAIAGLPYRWAYLTWIGLSIGLFLGGYWMLSPLLPQMNREQLVLGALLLLSWPPLLLYSLVNGQVCAVYFFSVACTLRLVHEGCPMLAGVVLSLSTYKPTLLLLVVPMLLLTRQWLVVAGLVAGVVVLASISVATVGIAGCLAWVGAVRQLAANEHLQLQKYVDIGSFSRLLVASQSGLATALASGIILAGAVVLFGVWSRRPRSDVAWSLALVWGIVLSPYGPVYEGVTVAIGALLLVNFTYEREGRIPNTLRALLTVLYLVPWVTQEAAQRFGLQLMTLAVVAIGVWALWSTAAASEEGIVRN